MPLNTADSFDALWQLGSIPLARVYPDGRLWDWNSACAAIGGALAAEMPLAEWLLAVGASDVLVKRARAALDLDEPTMTLADDRLTVQLIRRPAGLLAVLQANIGGTSASELLHERRVRDEIGQMANVGGWEIDLVKNQPRWDPHTFRIHEVPIGAQPPMDQAIDFFTEEARPVIAAAVEDGIANGKGWDLELPFVTAKGKERWVRAIGKPDFKDGAPVRLWGVFQDITQRKQQALALEAAYKRALDFERLFETGRAMVCTATFEGYFQLLNPAWTRVLGWTLDELRAKPFVEFVHPDDVLRTAAETARLGEEGATTLHFENRYLHKDGRWVWLSWHAISLDGLFYSVALDITEQRQWRDERARLAMIAERTDNAVLVTDPQGLTVWANAGFTRVTGYTLQEALGRTPGSLLQGPETDPEVSAYMRDRVAEGEGFRAELLNYRKSGEAYWVSIEAQPLRDGQGVLTGFMGIERDITEEREHARALMQAKVEADRLAEAALAAAKARSAFLASMSHEIRTPMNGVLGMAQLLADTTLTEEQRHFVDQIYGSGTALLRLLNDQLDFSKAEAGMMRIEPAAFEPRALLRMVSDLYQRPAAERGVALRATCDETVPAWLLGDAGRLRQVLFNLIGNAIKFTERGSVDVALVAEEGGSLRFTVEDTGIGIAADALERIFDPYQQVDDATTRRFTGSGLGLAICRELVTLMGGELTVTSTEGQGSRFTFALRLAQAQAPQQTTTPSSPPPGSGLLSGMRVLVAEDNLINQQVVAAMLTGRGAEVRLVDDGQQAVDAVAAERFHAVLMDWHMPKMDGVEATRLIRAAERGNGAHVPIVMLTARATQADARTCLEAGADHYLVKPVEWDALVRALGKQ